MENLRYDWKEVVALDPKGYMEIQNQKKGLVFHGPIKKVEVNKYDFVILTFEWVAQMPLPNNKGFGEWEKAPNEQIVQVFPNLKVPFVIEDTPEKGKRIRFAGLNIIYVDKIQGIDPAQVRGLKI
jgi:hypothetical protein